MAKTQKKKPTKKKKTNVKPKPAGPITLAATPGGAKVPFPDLVTRVATGHIREDEVGRYFYSKGLEAGKYVPTLAINKQTVDTSGTDELAREVGNDLAYQALEAVGRANREAAGAKKPNGTIVAEGDSWFNLPELDRPIVSIPPTLVDVLSLDYPINNIAHWGDTLAQIVRDGEYIKYLKTGKVRFLLFSAGGNDVLGDGHLDRFVNQRKSGDNDPANAWKYINSEFFGKLDEVMTLYGILVENVRQLSPDTVIILHGYDYALPVTNGPWLGRAMASRGFLPHDNRAICRAVIATMLGHFNERLQALAAQSNGRVRYVSLLDVVGNAWWDELHPDKTVVDALAARFEDELG